MQPPYNSANISKNHKKRVKLFFAFFQIYFRSVFGCRFEFFSCFWVNRLLMKFAFRLARGVMAQGVRGQGRPRSSDPGWSCSVPGPSPPWQAKERSRRYFQQYWWEPKRWVVGVSEAAASGASRWGASLYPDFWSGYKNSIKSCS